MIVTHFYGCLSMPCLQRYKGYVCVALSCAGSMLHHIGVKGWRVGLGAPDPAGAEWEVASLLSTDRKTVQTAPVTNTWRPFGRY